MRRQPAVIALAVLAVLALGAPAAVHAATCTSDPGVIAAMDVVFVGTVTSVDPAGSQATMAVAEVWSAGKLASVVVVTGPPGQWSGQGTGPYLVLATVINGALRLGDGGEDCSVAIPWDASFEALRPTTAHPPKDVAKEGGLPVPFLVIGGAIALIAAVSVFAFRTPRTPAA